MDSHHATDWRCTDARTDGRTDRRTDILRSLVLTWPFALAIKYFIPQNCTLNFNQFATSNVIYSQNRLTVLPDIFSLTLGHIVVSYFFKNYFTLLYKLRILFSLCSEKNTHFCFIAQFLERVTNLNENFRQNS